MTTYPPETKPLPMLWMLPINQNVIAAGLEEVALWIEACGYVDTHENIVTALETVDVNADAIKARIDNPQPSNHYQRRKECGWRSISVSFLIGGGGANPEKPALNET